jgi:hypothetical protein
MVGTPIDPNRLRLIGSGWIRSNGDGLERRDGRAVVRVYALDRSLGTSPPG